MKTIRASIFLFLGLYCININAQGDDCASATVLIPEDGSCTSPGYSNAGFTSEVGDPTPTCWADAPDNSAWFSFTATAGQVSINTNFTVGAGDMNDTQLALFDGTCGSFSELACNEDILVSNPMAAFQYYGLTVGNTYYILVDGYGGQTGGFNLCLENLADPTPPTAGQDCDDSAPICDDSAVSYTNVSLGGGTPEIPSCFSFGEGNSTWVSWVAGSVDPIEFDIVPTVSTDDYDFALYDLGPTGDCTSKTELACNYDVPCTGGPPGDRPYVGMAILPAGAPCPQQYETAVVPTPGNVYAILVSNFSGSDGFTLNWPGGTDHMGPTASFTALPTTVCSGQNVVYTNSSSGPNALGYSWDFGDGSPASSAVNPSYAFTAAGSYTTTLTVIDQVIGCIATDTEVITVNASPTANFTSDAPVCDGDLVTYTNTSTGALSYEWDFTNDAIIDATTTNATNTFATDGSYFTALIATNGTGCTDTVYNAVVVNALPTVSAGVDQAVCDGVSVTLAGTGATSYIWDNSVTDGVSFTPAVGTITYTVTGTDANSCQNTDQVDVEVYALPTVSAGVDQEVCDGTAVTLSGSGATSYAWDNSVSDGVAFTPAVGSITYTVTGTDGNSCVNTDQVDVTVNALPSVSAGGDQEVCEGTAVTLSGSGASSYSWDNGVTNAVAFTPGSGTVTYTVTGTDVNSCQNTDQVDVVVNTLPAVSAGVDQAVCDGVSVTLSGSGATSYVWDNSVTDGVAFTPSVGSITYTVTGTDANSCVNTDQVDVVVNVLPTVSAGIDQIVCDGTTVTLAGSGATSYAWDNSVTDGVGFVPAVGSITYTVTGTDGNSCVNTDQVDVTVNALPTVSAGIDQVVCDGATVTLSGSGATSYTWDNSVTDGIGFIPAVGTLTYTVTGTDANSCVNTDQADVTVNALPTVNAGIDQIECEGTSVTLSGSGATSYAWDNSVTDGVSFVPAIGTITYTVTGTDANSCVNTDQVDVTINANPDASITPPGAFCPADPATNLTAATGGGTWAGTGITDVNAGTFDPSVAGNGTWTITYSITDGNGCSANDSEDLTVNNSSDATITAAGPFCTDAGLQFFTAASGGGAWSGTGISNTSTGEFDPSSAAAGTYTITYTIGGACGSTDTEDFTIWALPSVSAGVDQAVCDGATVTLSGTGAASYTWDNGVTDGAGFIPAVGTLTYTVTGTDGNGCQNTDAADVVVNALPTVDAGIDQVVCDGASVTLSGSGAASYSWDNSVTDGVSFTPIVGSITYTVTGTDVNSCVNTDQVDVDVNALPAVNAGIDQAVCDGAPVTLSGSGATSYVWDNSITDGVSFTPVVGTLTYTVTGTDANSCVNTDQVDVTVYSNPDATITLSGPYCPSDAAVNLTSATGGGTWGGTGITDVNAGTFDPSVSGSGTFTITYSVTDINTCTDSDTEDFLVNTEIDASITAPLPKCEDASAFNLSAVNGGGSWSGTGITDVNAGVFDPATSGSGTFTITYSIGGACPTLDTEVVQVDTLPNSTITAVGPFCTGDASVVLDGTTMGGTWAGIGITDVNNGDFDPGTAGLGTHNITYSVTDGNGCSNNDDVDIVVTSTMDATIASVLPVCVDLASFTFTAVDNGGAWSGTGITDVNAGTFDPATAGSGTHTITYTISGGCGDVDTYDVLVNALPDATITAAGPFCEDASSVALNAATNGGTWSGTGITNVNTGVFDPAAATSGTHTITYNVTDVNSCSNSATEDINVNALPDPAITVPAPACEDALAFNLAAATNGGTWNGNGITDVNAGTFDPATSGSGSHAITYTVVDGNGCTDSDNRMIVINALPDPTITSFGPFCIDEASSDMSAATAGGSWTGTGITDNSLGSFNPAIAGVGTHTIAYAITDGNSCSSSDNLDVEVNGLPDASVTPENPVCEDALAFNMTAATAGGTWSGTGISDISAGTFDPLLSGAGQFNILYAVTDVNGCSANDSWEIQVVPLPDAGFTTNSPYCENTSAEFLTSVTSGGIYSGTGITDGALGTFDPANSGPGTFTITYAVTDPLGCSNTESTDVVVNTTPAAAVANDLIACYGDGNAELQATGDNVSWYTDATLTDNVSTSLTYTSPETEAGTYTYFIVNELAGCTSSASSVEFTINAVDASLMVSTYEGASPLPVDFTNTSITAGSVVWDFGNGDVSSDENPSYTYSEGGDYEVVMVITTAQGCVDTAFSDIISVEDVSVFEVPNVFTPNADGYNDFFNIEAEHLENITCEVFNRWGALVYKWNTSQGGWDGRTQGGTIAPEGTYYFIINAVGADGKVYQDKGDLLLLREK